MNERLQSASVYFRHPCSTILSFVSFPGDFARHLFPVARTDEFIPFPVVAAFHVPKPLIARKPGAIEVLVRVA